MKEPSDAIQAAEFAALTASTALKALIGDPARVYDKTPDNAEYPYIRIGEHQVIDDSNGCADAWEVHSTVHIFSRSGAPRPEVKAIQNVIAGILGADDTPISPAGFTVTEAKPTTSNSYMEQDGATCHGVSKFRYLVDDAA